MRRLRYELLASWFGWVLAVSPVVQAAPRGDGQFQIEVVDSATGKPIAARMHLENARGRPVSPRLPQSAEFGGHFYIDGRIILPLRMGQYTFDLEAGPEYRTQRGHFEIERYADDSTRIEMSRFADLVNEGWYAGDLDVARPPSDLPLILRAEGLHVAPLHVPSRALKGARQSSESTAELVASLGGDLLVYNLTSPVDFDAALRLSSLSSMRKAREENARLVARTPYAWDMPVWLASGDLDAILVIHHHALRDGTLDNEDDGRPRDRSLFPGRTGNGRWSEKVYYHALNCGLRISPGAGSGSGTSDNPVGINRVYVHCGDKFSSEAWWDGLESGRVFVTNGPLLWPHVEGKPPGHVFRVADGEARTFEIGLDLATRVPIEYLQIIKNGEVAAEARLDDWAGQKGRLPPLVMDGSGWFLVRAVTSNERTYQHASSGPYYVEHAGSPRISRRSVQFFLDWIAAAEARLHDLTVPAEAERKALLAEQQSARAFFQELLSKANAD